VLMEKGFGADLMQAPWRHSMTTLMSSMFLRTRCVPDIVVKMQRCILTSEVTPFLKESRVGSHYQWCWPSAASMCLCAKARESQM